jgi:hypothetical protein
VEEVTIIESCLSMRQGDPLKGPLFALAHYQTFLKPSHMPPTTSFHPLQMIPTLWGL